jgi:hypothetical protein
VRENSDLGGGFASSDTWIALTFYIPLPAQTASWLTSWVDIYLRVLARLIRMNIEKDQRGRPIV